MEEEIKYFRCSKCGQSLTYGTEKTKAKMCMADFPYRLSGFCGGAMSIEITKSEYDKQIEEWNSLPS